MLAPMLKPRKTHWKKKTMLAPLLRPGPQITVLTLASAVGHRNKTPQRIDVGTDGWATATVIKTQILAPIVGLPQHTHQ